jgi:hypothetical protein
LGDVVPSVEPVRSHAGVNVAGPPILDRNAGSQRNKCDELGIIIREGRRVEGEHVRHLNVVLLLNSITEMRVGWWERDSRSAQQTFESCSTCGGGVRGLGGALMNGRQDTKVDGWMDGWMNRRFNRNC